MNRIVSRPYIRLTGLALAIASTIGCAVGPNYKRPSVDVPVTYRGAQAEQDQAPHHGEPQRATRFRAGSDADGDG